MKKITFFSGVRTERKMCLCHTDGKSSKTLFRIHRNLSLGFLFKSDCVCTVDLFGDNLDLFFDADVERIQKFEVAGLFASVYDGLGEVDCAGTTWEGQGETYAES